MRAVKLLYLHQRNIFRIGDQLRHRRRSGDSAVDFRRLRADPRDVARARRLRARHRAGREGIRRRDISLRIKERIYQAAFVFLVLFAVMVIYNDVLKMLPSIMQRTP